MTSKAAQEAQDPTEPQLTIRVLAMPADANPQGDIFGGWLMSQIDIGGSVVAIQTAQGKVVTVAVNEMRFILPVLVGDLVSIYARLKRVGRTSVTVEVEAFAEREQERNQLQRVATATLTYVAVDGNGRPRVVVPV